MKKSLFLILCSCVIGVSQSATLLLHYGMGEEGSIVNSNYVDDVNHQNMNHPNQTTPIIHSVTNGAPGSSSYITNTPMAWGSTITTIKNNTDSYMVSLWVNPVLTSNQALFSLEGKLSTQQNLALKLVMTTAGTLHLSNHNVETYGSSTGTDAAGTITAGNWNNIVMIYDAANSLYRFALNGTLMDFQVNSTDKTVDWTQTTNLTMGVAPGGSSDRTDANTGLDEFKIYGVNNGEDLATLVQNEYANGNANIPEPATATLSALGLLSLLTLRRRH